MLKIDQLKAMNVGDAFEAGSILDGVTDELVTWTCKQVEVIDNATCFAVFVLSYFDIELCEVTGEIVKNKIVWEEVA